MKGLRSDDSFTYQYSMMITTERGVGGCFVGHPASPHAAGMGNVLGEEQEAEGVTEPEVAGRLPAGRSRSIEGPPNGRSWTSMSVKTV